MRAFKGVRVIDFSRVLSGPVATQMLGLLDADVIKIEPPGDGDQLRGVLTDPEMAAKRMSPAFLTVNLNKRSIALDLKSDAGRAAALKPCKLPVEVNVTSLPCRRNGHPCHF